MKVSTGIRYLNMARQAKHQIIDLTQAHNFTAGLIERLTCPEGKQQAFVRDADTKGLRIRLTANGSKSYVFEKKLNGKNIRQTIGDVSNWSIEAARSEARRLSVMLDQGIDPREVKREMLELAEHKKDVEKAKREAEKLAGITVQQAWDRYLELRRPFWGELHYQDHITKAHVGGVLSKRRGNSQKLTQPGPLAALMQLKLKNLDQQTIEAWAQVEAKTRATSARLAWRLLSVFLTWCEDQKEYAGLLQPKNPAKSKKAREAFGKPGVKKDVLQKSQLKAWFASVQAIRNPTIAACLQVLLLTGARLNEVLSIRWSDVDLQWKSLKMNDKVEGERIIPLTPYVEKLITALPRLNEYVFASSMKLNMDDKNIARRGRKSAAKGQSAFTGSVLDTSKTGYISEPNTPHTNACKRAGIEGLTLHGLRRSFKSLTEWLEIPVGVVAQIQGHKPSATAEKHYTIRPIELLALHHCRIENWLLEQADLNVK